MDNRETEIIQQAEKFIRKTASMIGHKNANNLLEVVKLAKKQRIELTLYMMNTERVLMNVLI